MPKTYAMLLDGGFVKRELGKHRPYATAESIKDFCRKVQELEELRELDLYRIYFYDAWPSKARRKHPITGEEIDFEKQDAYARNEKLLNELAASPNVALRLGQLAMQGWKLGTQSARKKVLGGQRTATARDVVPNFKQKGVDLRIGLDIAKLSLQRIVDVIVLVTGDSDLVPAMRFARREGCRTYLCTMSQKDRPEMMKDADLVLRLP